MKQSEIYSGLVTICKMRLIDSEFPYVVELKDPLAEFKHIIQRMRSLHNSRSDYPTSSKINWVTETDEETYFKEYPVDSNNPRKYISSVIHDLYTLQELVQCQKRLGEMRHIYQNVTFETLLYSLGFNFGRTYVDDDHIEPWDCGYHDYMKNCDTMAKGYHESILPFIKKNRDKLPRLNYLYANIWKCRDETCGMLKYFINDNNSRLSMLQDIIKHWHQDEGMIKKLLNERIEQYMKRFSKEVLNSVRGGILRNEYKLEEKMTQAYRRKHNCSIQDLIGEDFSDEPVEQFDYFMRLFRPRFIDDPIYHKDFKEEDYNCIWEYLCCIVEIRLLQSLEKGGRPFPNPYFPVPNEPEQVVETKKTATSIFDSKDAKPYWDKLKEKKLIDTNRKLKKGLSDNDAAYIAMKFNEVLRPGKRKDWKYFETLWGKSSFRTADCTKNEFPRNAQKIDKAFS